LSGLLKTKRIVAEAFLFSSYDFYRKKTTPGDKD
jgi:hypothetical protein